MVRRKRLHHHTSRITSASINKVKYSSNCSSNIWPTRFLKTSRCLKEFLQRPWKEKIDWGEPFPAELVTVWTIITRTWKLDAVKIPSTKCASFDHTHIYRRFRKSACRCGLPCLFWHPIFENNLHENVACAYQTPHKAKTNGSARGGSNGQIQLEGPLTEAIPWTDSQSV